MRRAAVALSVATLFFGRQIAAWSDPENRYLYHWTRGDGLYLIAAVVLTALLLLGAGLAVRRWGGPAVRRRARLALAVVAGQLLVALVLAADAERPFEGAAVASFAALGLVWWGWRRDEARVGRYATTLCLVLAPLGPILFLQILTWQPWRPCGPDRAGPAPRAGAQPVFILLFDEWSLERSMAGGEFLPSLPRLRELARRSRVFTAASAPGDATLKSIPRILFQENGGVVVGDGSAEWRSAGGTVPAPAHGNLFRVARARGYRTELEGWYLPYAALVGNDLDRCRTYPQVPKRDGAARLLDLAWANLRHLPDPASRALWRELYSRWFSRNWYELAHRIEDDAVRRAREAPANTFALFHFPLPHAPFVFQPDGSYRGPFPEGRMEGTVEDYGRQLRYLDGVLGRFLDALEGAGKLDSAIVVVTSDHSWKKDPVRAARARGRLRRVPLVVTWPGSREGEREDESFCLLDLASAIEGAAGGGGPAAPASRCAEARAAHEPAQSHGRHSGLQRGGADRADPARRRRVPAGTGPGVRGAGRG